MILSHTPFKIMAHFIAGYPNVETSLQVARGLAEGGAFALEMQIPFSDPSADGPVIEKACHSVLEQEFRTADAWTLLEKIRKEQNLPIFVMSYASLVMVPGVETFVKKAVDAGASGLIIPDLVPGNDEGLFEAADKVGCPSIPVVVPSISEKRMDEIVALNPQWIYTALRSGITGTRTQLGLEQENFLGKLKKAIALKGGQTGIMAGFGIQNREQVEQVSSMADAVVVGSLLVQTIMKSEPSKAEDAVRSLLSKLT